MIENGQRVYYLINGVLFSGRIMDLECVGNKQTFSIDSYGGCEGQFVIDIDQLHQRVFLSIQEAEAAAVGFVATHHRGLHTLRHRPGAAVGQ